ncbi:MAG: SprB repeat-containing protein [Bacteroidetes bacterium]|nr:SprB repeat-containing protein [Bacteroidota bacterium]
MKVRFTINGDTASFATVDLSGQVVDSVTVIKSWTAYAANVTTFGASGATVADGSATVAVNGPHPPYTFLWSNAATSATTSNLLPGAYTVSITDANGCVRVDSAFVWSTVSSSAMVNSQIQIYPNPFHDRCRIDFPNPGHQPCTLAMYDTAGKQVRSIGGSLPGQSGLNRATSKREFTCCVFVERAFP